MHSTASPNALVILAAQSATRKGIPPLKCMTLLPVSSQRFWIIKEKIKSPLTTQEDSKCSTFNFLQNIYAKQHGKIELEIYRYKDRSGNMYFHVSSISNRFGRWKMAFPCRWPLGSYTLRWGDGFHLLLKMGFIQQQKMKDGNYIIMQRCYWRLKEMEWSIYRRLLGGGEAKEFYDFKNVCFEDNVCQLTIEK